MRLAFGPRVYQVLVLPADCLAHLGAVFRCEAIDKQPDLL